MEKLIELIVQIRDMATQGGYYQEGHPQYDEDLYYELAEELCEELITDTARPNFAAHAELKESMDTYVCVVPGETDSFGWLTGVLVVNIVDDEDPLEIVYG